MKLSLFRLSSSIFAALAGLPLALADQNADHGADDTAAEPKSSVTQHSVTIDGDKIDYTATAGLSLIHI